MNEQFITTKGLKSQVWMSDGSVFNGTLYNLDETTEFLLFNGDDGKVAYLAVNHIVSIRL